MRGTVELAFQWSLMSGEDWQPTLRQRARHRPEILEDAFRDSFMLTVSARRGFGAEAAASGQRVLGGCWGG
ncbi:MAG: hypothetical protein CMJ98_04930 [Planctomycetes bacterium]|jgi:hypothetical protein|nr:hypothetical protein [Planctomycetota bacterium]